MRKFLTNISYTIFSNSLSLLISAAIVLIVPKFISIENYGYLQLYIFYVSYIGFLHFGWNDGIYLRYGGADFNKLDKTLFFSQFYSLLIFQLILALLFYIFSLLYIDDTNKLFIIHVAILAMVVENTKTMLLFIMQITGRIKEYAQTVVITKTIYLMQVFFIILVLCIKNYHAIIIADIVSRCIGLIFIGYTARQIVWNSPSVFRVNFTEIYNNISVGFKLMSANIVGMLIIGVSRFAVERVWGIATFGQISLAISLSNIAMVFINAISIVLYPMLCHYGYDKLKSEFSWLDETLNLFLSATLIFYYPLIFFFQKWLEQYTLSLYYIGLLFPILLFECKNSLLLCTYMKSLRLESAILRTNMAALAASFVFTYFFTSFFTNLTALVLSIVAILMFRCFLNEMYLIRFFSLRLRSPMIMPYILALIFVCCNMRYGHLTSVLIGISAIFVCVIFSYIQSKKNILPKLKVFLKR